MKTMGSWHRDLDLKLAERIGSVTSDDRQSLLSLVNCVVELALTSRKCSILALEKQREQIADKDLSTGMRMLIDGTETDTVVTWFRNRIVYSDMHGLDLLRLVVITTGIDAIGNACEPQFIRDFLVSYLGESLITEIGFDSEK